MTASHPSTSLVSLGGGAVLFRSRWWRLDPAHKMTKRQTSPCSPKRCTPFPPREVGSWGERDPRSLGWNGSSQRLRQTPGDQSLPQ